MWLKAGTDRNQEMLDESKPDLILAFSSDIENSTGTSDMVRRAKKVNLPVRVYNEEGLVAEYNTVKTTPLF